MSKKSKREFMQAYDSVRKEMPRPSRVIMPKDKHRRDRAWKWDENID